ncbi:MAG: cell division protein FtsX [Vicinamibacterales bacterium]
MMRRIGQAIAEGAANMRHSWRSAALAIAAIVSAVFVLGVFLVLSRAVDAALARWTEAAELSVFLADPVPSEARSTIEHALASSGLVRDVRLVSDEDAAARFGKSFPDLAPLVTSTDMRLPASIEARLNPDADLQAVLALTERVRSLPGVGDVRVDQELLTGVLTIAQIGRFVAGGLAALLVLAGALAIASVVRLSYLARRDEVDVLYLLGAPLPVIRGPFVAEGALQGGLGTTVALAWLAIGQQLFLHRYQSALGDLRVAPLPLWLMAALLAAGILVGGVAGLAAVRERRPDDTRGQ